MDYKIIKIFRKPHLAYLAIIVVTILLGMPTSDIDTTSVPFINDKVVHATVFAGLGFLWHQYKKSIIGVSFGLFLYAVGSEIMQYLLPESFGRSFDVMDIVADVYGILLGIVVSIIVNSKFGDLK